MHRTLLLSLLLASSLAQAATVFSFGFDSGLQGWTGATSGTPLNPVWQASGGNPGGYYTVYDNTFREGTNYGVIQASTVLSNLPAYVPTSTLSFDVRASNPFNITGLSLAAIWSGRDSQTGQFSFSSYISTEPNAVWQTITIPLSSFTCDQSSTFPCASWSEIANLNIDLTYSGLTGNAPASVSLDLDNVTLTSGIPEPSGAPLSLLGIAVMSFVAWQRKRRITSSGRRSYFLKPY